MNKQFINVSYPNFDVLFSSAIIKGSGFTEKLSEVKESGFVMYGEESYPCVNMSDYVSQYIASPMESQFWAYVLLAKKDFPKLQNQFKDENPCFALGTTTGHFFVTDVSLADFVVLPGDIGECVQKLGVSAFRFTENKKIQYLVDLELFINNVFGGKR